MRRTFEYKCTDELCHVHFDIKLEPAQVTRNELVLCPDCGAPARRVYTPVGMSWKGGKPSAACSTQRYKV